VDKSGDGVGEVGEWKLGETHQCGTPVSAGVVGYYAPAALVQMGVDDAKSNYG